MNGVLRLVAGELPLAVLRRVEGVQRVDQLRPAEREVLALRDQRGRRFFRHPRIAGGGGAGDAFEQAQDAPHAVNFVEGADELHFRGAGLQMEH